MVAFLLPLRSLRVFVRPPIHAIHFLLTLLCFTFFVKYEKNLPKNFPEGLLGCLVSEPLDFINPLYSVSCF